MDSLIDRLLTVEGEAGAVIETARAEAKELDKQANAAIAAMRQEVSAEVDRKLAAFREELLKRHEVETAKQKAEAERALEEVGRVPEAVVSRQVEKAVARFREI